MLRNCTPEDCPFCEILNIERREIIWESEKLFAFHDLYKKGSKEHLQLCSKEHIKNIDTLEPSHMPLLLEMKQVSQSIMDLCIPNAKLRLGFHKPPLYSIGHLHQHILAEPIEGFYYDKQLFGLNLATQDDVIEKLKKKTEEQENPQPSCWNCFQSESGNSGASNNKVKPIKPSL